MAETEFLCSFLSVLSHCKTNFFSRLLAGSSELHINSAHHKDPRHETKSIINETASQYLHTSSRIDISHSQFTSQSPPAFQPHEQQQKSIQFQNSPLSSQNTKHQPILLPPAHGQLYFQRLTSHYLKAPTRTTPPLAMCIYRAYFFTCEHFRTVCLSRCNGSLHELKFDDRGVPFLFARCGRADPDLAVGLQGPCWGCYFEAEKEALTVQRQCLGREVEKARWRALERFVEGDGDRAMHEARLDAGGEELYDKMLTSCCFGESYVFKAVLERARREGLRIEREQVVLHEQELRRLRIRSEKKVRGEIDERHPVLPRREFHVSPRRIGGSKLKFEYNPNEEDSSDEAVDSDSDSVGLELELFRMVTEELEKLRASRLFEEVICKLQGLELDGGMEVDPGQITGGSDEDPCRDCPGCDYCCGI